MASKDSVKQFLGKFYSDLLESDKAKIEKIQENNAQDNIELLNTYGVNSEKVANNLFLLTMDTGKLKNRFVFLLSLGISPK